MNDIDPSEIVRKVINEPTDDMRKWTREKQPGDSTKERTFNASINFFKSTFESVKKLVDDGFFLSLSEVVRSAISWFYFYRNASKKDLIINSGKKHRSSMTIMPWQVALVNSSTIDMNRSCYMDAIVAGYIHFFMKKFKKFSGGDIQE